MMPLRAVSLFAGIGGICLGFQQVGYSVKWANELDAAACMTYRHNFGGAYLVEGDIRKLDAASIPDFDVLTAGFPCQSFSVGGAQRGFNDRRGALFFEVARVIDQKRPAVVFLENVENLLEHDNGRTFLVIYTTLVQLGYYVRYQIMPTNLYGNLPQSRKRIYIVAFRNLEQCNRFMFPEPIPLTVGIFDIISPSEKKHGIYYLEPDDQYTAILNRTVTDPQYIYRLFNGSITKLRNGLCPTLTASMGMRKNGAVIRDDYGVRRLTLRECLDFQGFPPEYYFPKGISMEAAYKQIGNSVSVPVIRRVANALLQSFE